MDSPGREDRDRPRPRRGRLLHPLLFAIYPVLFLYAHNSGRYSLPVIFRPLAATLGLALVTWALACLLLRSRSKGALLTTALLIICFSYGHLHPLVSATGFDSGFAQLGPARVLLLAYVFVVGIVGLILARTKGAFTASHLFATVVGTILVTSALVQIGAAAVESKAKDRPDVKEDLVLEVPKGQRPPDIYYIVLDGYAREDVLATLYGYPDNPLVGFLEESGFRVVENARSNYGQTTLSLASSLSMELLDDLAAEIGTNATDRQPLRSRIKESRVSRLLRPLGYQYVAFATGYFSTEARSADVFLSPGIALNEFENVLFTSTPFPEVLDILGKKTQERLHRKRILYILDHLADPLELDAPVFVLAHVVAPHPPFVFGADGEPATYPGKYTLADGDDLVGTRGIEKEDYRRLYRDQLQYLNGQVISGLRRLLSEARNPLVIIIQGDHGPGSGLVWEDGEATDLWERLSILNAYYVSDSDYRFVHEGITPVNSFRGIFSQYFGAALPPLPDRSFFSTESQPYDFSDITGEVVPPNAP